MDAKQQAAAVLEQLMSWIENTEAAVNAGDWAEVGDQARRLQTFNRMLRHLVDQQTPQPPPTARPVTTASSAAARILRKAIYAWGEEGYYTDSGTCTGCEAENVPTTNGVCADCANSTHAA